LSFLAGSYSYAQSPGADPGPLLPETLTFGDGNGGAAPPLGFAIDARGFLPKVPALGFVGGFKFGRYQVESSAFSDPAVDNLLAADVAVVGRAPLRIGTAMLGIGARAGYRFDDFNTFRGCLTAGCSVVYRPVSVSGLDVGLDLELDVWRLLWQGTVRGGFAYGTQPYAWDIETHVGFRVVGPLVVDAGFHVRERRSELVSAENADLVYGRIADRLYEASVGLGVAF
jgi:hypothetical protein